MRESSGKGLYALFPKAFKNLTCKTPSMSLKQYQEAKDGTVNINANNGLRH